MSIISTIRKIRDEIATTYFEMETVAEALWTGILAGEHVFILGQPGVAKTEMSSDTLERIVGDPMWTGPKGEPGRLFWRLQFLKTTPLEKLAGMYDVPAIREKGEYHHNIKGFLPTARYGLADELGKASPISRDPLLSMTAGNPGKRFFDNNAFTMKVPLLTLVSTSNEELDEEEDGAIWDRQTIRVKAEDPKDPANNRKLVELAMGGIAASTFTTVEFPDLYKAIFDEVPNIHIPSDVVEAAAMDIPAELAKKGQRVSPRRKVKAGRVLQASAYLNGRSQVEMDDLAALRFLLWDKAEQISDIERIVLKTSNPLMEEALTIKQDVDRAAAELAAIDPGLGKKEAMRLHVEKSALLGASKTRLSEMVQEAKAHGRSTTALKEIEARCDQVRNEARSALMAF